MKHLLIVFSLLTTLLVNCQQRRNIGDYIVSYDIPTFNVEVINIEEDSVEFIPDIVEHLIEIEVASVVLFLNTDEFQGNPKLDKLLDENDNIFIYSTAGNKKYQGLERFNFHKENIPFGIVPLVTKFDYKIEDELHLAVKVATSFKPSIADELKEIDPSQLYINYWGNCLYFTTQWSSDTIFYDVLPERIVLVTHLEKDYKEMTPYNIWYPDLQIPNPYGVVDNSCGKLEPGMFSTYILANMIHTLTEATNLKTVVAEPNKR